MLLAVLPKMALPLEDITNFLTHDAVIAERHTDDERMADAEMTLRYLEQMDKSLLTLLHYPENYHKNFNEVNREEIFSHTLSWVETECFQ